MVIGFKKQFIHPIFCDVKIHTIRQDATNRWKAGMKMHMAIGVRTKDYKQFAEKTCISIQKVKIIVENDYKVVIVDERPLSLPEIKKIAINDGFDSVEDFFNWFSESFEGKIIHWTEMRY